MDDIARLALIRETINTFWQHSEDPEGDKNLSDQALCLEFLADLVDEGEPDTAGLVRDEYVTAARLAEITDAEGARGHIKIKAGQWRIETYMADYGGGTPQRGRADCVYCTWYAYEIAAAGDTSAGGEWITTDLAALLDAAAAHQCPVRVTDAYAKAHPDGH
jgi:hypothetical protein